MPGRALPVLVALAAVPACGSEPPPPPMSAEVRQYRSDVALRTLSVTVTNGSGAPVVVERVQLAAPGLEQLPPVEVDAELPPGDRVDLPVRYGAAACPPGRGSSADHARVVVRTADGERHELELALPTGNGLLQRLRDKDCAERALRSAVDLQLSQRWVRDGLQLRGSLVLTRQAGDQVVTVTEAGAHIVFTVRPAAPADPLAVLAAGQQRAEVPLGITATRCDGHALSSNSRNNVFTFYVAVGDAEPLQTATLTDPSLQAQLERLARDTCFPG